MATKGGTERMIAEKANYLSEQFGYDVTIITCFQLPNETNFFYTSPKIRQINLHIPYFKQYKYKYPKRLWVKWQMNRLLRKRIHQYVNQIDPDIIIGVSRFKAHYISKIKCRAKKVIECHVVKFNTLYFNEGNRSFLFRTFIQIYNYIYFRTIENYADTIVTLTEEDKLLYKRAKRKLAIPNFSTMRISQYSDCTQKRIIAVGHLIWGKGFDRLIKIWKMVSTKHPDWHLDIFGEGYMYDTIMAHIKNDNTNNVTIHKCTSDISQEYAQSSICAITSYYEGFSLVALEAMRHGVPCVAFDCPFGPRTIINHGQCGFLVENDDIRCFSDKLCLLIENKKLRYMFSKAAIKQAKNFDIDIIMNKWKALFEELAYCQ